MRRFIALSALLAVSSTADAAERPLVIPSDAKAKYTILEVGGEWPNRTIVTRRVGSSGTTYSKRLYNCSNNTVKYLGTGDTLADMAKSNADPKMTPIISQSIADHVGRQACKR